MSLRERGCPTLPSDLPCPNSYCNADAGERCNMGRARGDVHAARVERLKQAQADWIRLQQWLAGEPIR